MRKAECILLNQEMKYIDPNIIDMVISGNIINRNTNPIVQLSIYDNNYPLRAGENNSTFEIETDTNIYKLEIVEGDILEVSFYKILVKKIL